MYLCATFYAFVQKNVHNDWHIDKVYMLNNKLLAK